MKVEVRNRSKEIIDMISACRANRLTDEGIAGHLQANGVSNVEMIRVLRYQSNLTGKWLAAACDLYEAMKVPVQETQLQAQKKFLKNLTSRETE